MRHSCLISHFEAKTKPPSFRRRHFAFSWMKSGIALVLVTIRHWANADSVQWHVYASTGHNWLIYKCTVYSHGSWGEYLTLSRGNITQKVNMLIVCSSFLNWTRNGLIYRSMYKSVNIVNKAIVCSGNDLSPTRHQVIVWANDSLLSITAWVTYISMKFNLIKRAYVFMNMHLKISSAKWRPFRLSLNVIRQDALPTMADFTHRGRIWTPP